MSDKKKKDININIKINIKEKILNWTKLNKFAIAFVFISIIGISYLIHFTETSYDKPQFPKLPAEYSGREIDINSLEFNKIEDDELKKQIIAYAHYQYTASSSIFFLMLIVAYTIHIFF
jgi:hypothetical protein